MKAALVTVFGTLPAWQEFGEPRLNDDEVLVHMTAAAICPLTRARASGRHYSAGGGYPFVAGVDGTGTLDDGTPVYVLLPRSPYGTMAQVCAAPCSFVIPLPTGLEPVLAAAIANPAMSAWAALSERAGLDAQAGRAPGVLINGATGMSGRLAMKIARHFGASRIVATGRNRAVLDQLAADETVVLGQGEKELAAQFGDVFAQGIDLVLDYLWGPSAALMLAVAAKAAPKDRALRWIQIGTASAEEIALPGALLRSSRLELVGSGIGSVATERLLAAIAAVFEAAREADLTIPLSTVPMEDAEAAWSRSDETRVVLTLP